MDSACAGVAAGFFLIDAGIHGARHARTGGSAAVRSPHSSVLINLITRPTRVDKSDDGARCDFAQAAIVGVVGQPKAVIFTRPNGASERPVPRVVGPSKVELRSP